MDDRGDMVPGRVSTPTSDPDGEDDNVAVVGRVVAFIGLYVMGS